MTPVVEDRLPTIEGLRLGKGSHPDFEKGVCIMEAVAYVAGEPHSDHPKDREFLSIQAARPPVKGDQFTAPDGKPWTEEARDLDFVWLKNEWGEFKTVRWIDIDRNWGRG